MTTTRLWPAAVMCVALTGCGDEVATTSPTPVVTTSPPGPEQRYTITAPVLEYPEHGPKICTSGEMLASDPPQCGSIDVVGWDWTAVEGEESSSGTTWGWYTVVGTYDGVRLTLTEPARAPRPGDVSDPLGGGSSLDTPCDPPPGGWRRMPYPTAVEERLGAYRYALAQPDFAALWFDWSSDEPMTEGDTRPIPIVLNFRFTGDLDRHEAALRALWDGSLCVTKAELTQDELLEIGDEIATWEGILGVDTHDKTGKISVQAIVDDANLEQRLDARYGPELVTVVFALTPMPAEHGVPLRPR